MIAYKQEEFPLKEKDTVKTNENRKQSDLVTKESICATCTLFSLLAFLILCSGSNIFGGFGQAVCAFLTGVAGYCAYPLTALLLYNSFMGLIGKRIVRDRRTLFAVIFALCAVALIVHTVQTTMVWGWQTDSAYLEACLQAGESFPAVTAAGWLGGLLVLVVSSVLSNVGALILFSVVCLFAIYLAIVFIRGNRSKAEEKMQAEIHGQNVAPVFTPTSSLQSTAQQPVQTPIQPIQPMQSMSQPMPPRNESVPSFVQQETATAFSPRPYAQAPQRPGVNIPDEPVKKSGGFSPFGDANAMRERADETQSMERSYQNSREFLFGSTPAENYRQNLIYQSNSNANNLPSPDPATSPIHSGYTPSYTNAYADAVNADEREKPLKIVNDGMDFSLNERVSEGTEQTEDSARPMPISPMPSYESAEFSPQPVQDPLPKTPFVEREEIPFERADARTEDSREKPYERHDYMHLFSNENPNVFGRFEEEEKPDVSPFEPFAREDRPKERNAETQDWKLFGDETPTYPHREENREESALHIFDEEPLSDPYTLDTDRADRLDTSEERDTHYLDEPLEDRRDRSVFDDSSERGSMRDREEDGFAEHTYTDFAEDRDRSVDTTDVSFGFGSDRTTDRNTDRTAFDSVSHTDREDRALPVDDLLDRDRQIEPPVREEVKPVPKKPRVIRPYKRISLDDLDCRDIEPQANAEEVEQAKDTILTTLEDFKILGATIASVTFGPTVTRYNVTIPRNIQPKKVVALDQSIAINLHAEGVNIYPNFEDGVVSIEVPNKERQFVQLGSMLSGDTYVNAKPSALVFAMGKDVANRKVYGDISKMTHLLVAGASGSGKSVFLGSLIISLIHKYSPEELRLILIDPKKTEFVLYNGLPHLMINEIITEADKAVQSLNWAIEEMNRRYELFQQMSRSGQYVVNLEQYNAYLPKEERLPKIVIIIDELADLMLAAKKDIEEKIQNLTQKARAAGIHLIVATQRPSTDVITGVIKSNLPTRIAFGVATDVDSRVILDQTGAQKLLGKGDMLYVMQGLKTPVRVQSAFISPEDSQKVVNYIKANNEAYYDEEVTAYINNTRSGSSGDSSSRFDENNVEQVYIDALKFVILNGNASISMIQRKFSAGFNKAGKIIEWMEEMGYISPYDGAKARKVLITQEDFEKKYGPF